MRPINFLPVAAFLLIVGAFSWYLVSGEDPRVIPSPLIDKPVPEFDLPPLEAGIPGLASRDLAEGKVVLVNVFASWCAPCRIEHPFLSALAAEGVPIYGIAYKDAPEDTRAMLAELGNPYERIGVDRDGRVGIDLGVYGVPETYVVSGDGRIRHKHIGPILPANQDEIRAAIRAAGETP
ncbi:MAG: DsbE family thiol:disulfide interchange protein [Alphaproteobacteria bacterium]|nr:MAG: DsbE family thiol:disulfide interchange protein [Alphaproteobacteria bacterium]